VIGSFFSATTIPVILKAILQMHSTECETCFVYWINWLLVLSFIFVQFLQIPFRVLSFLDVWELRKRIGRDPLIAILAAFETAMEHRCWRLNHYFGFLGQYLVPMGGFTFCVVFGGGNETCYSNSTSPKFVWNWLLACLLLRIFFTILWGYYLPFHIPLPNTRQGSMSTSRGTILALENESFRIQNPMPIPTCSICYEDFQVNDSVIQLPCHRLHVFHKDCGFKWLNVSTSCPLCKKSVEIRLKKTQ